MLFTEKWLSTVFPTNKNVTDEALIEQVFIDSREQVKNGLFIPIVGERFDAHQFVLDAIENGASSILWEEDKPLPKDFPGNISVFFVEDTTKALQNLSYAYKNHVKPKVIGITGSNGKTTTKDLIANVAASSYRTHATQGNLNNHIGLPLTILSMPKDTEVLVLEMGMNAFGEIELLSNIAEPDISVITNIGESHIEFLGSREGIVEAKLEILSGMSPNARLIIDGDEKLLNNHKYDMKVISCGFHSNNNVKINDVNNNIHQTTFTINNESLMFEISLVGVHHAKNAAYAITVGKLLNIPIKIIKESLKNLELSGMRFEVTKGNNGVTLVNDAYNASPTSMIGAIETIKSLDGFKYKVLVLGDILELGEHAKKFHQQIGEHICDPITAVFTLGELAKEISHTVTKRAPEVTAWHAETHEQLLTFLEPHINAESIILFKASRLLEFEQFIQQFSNHE
ncbi:MAG TPA: UDP-N-acetylmuramoyl-tripeptide--D-alanyl-D-alanine ligase [Bacillota bacterium]|nr:UDP-N-acetylmuramoyl-tripeptide--D-alanyl-D-alanine ligase [Bacillota bacterium]